MSEAAPDGSPDRLAQARRDYQQGALRKSDLLADPFEQLALWLDDALRTRSLDATTMTLATATSDGRPSARVVLLKGFDQRGLVFYTSYVSQKARDLAQNPFAAGVFYWAGLERQVRVTGRVEKTSRVESESYFQSRPRGSQIGAAAWPQSDVVPDRATLEQRFAQLDANTTGPMKTPHNWGGYRLAPDSFELWQGRPSRLHDRFRYSRQEGGGWTLVRLAP